MSDVMHDISFVQIATDIESLYGLTKDGRVFTYRHAKNSAKGIEVWGWVPLNMQEVTGMVELHRLATEF